MTQALGKKDSANMPKLTLKDIHQFVFERFSEIKDMADLVKFHSINKYLLMAHNPNQLNKLGNIVANHEKLDISEILANYQIELEKTFTFRPTVKSHSNTLQHILGHFSPDLTKSEKKYFLGVLENYRKGAVLVGDALEILKECTEKYEKSYLSSQTYFLFFTNPQ